MLGTSPSMPCWTSQDVSCYGEKCTGIVGNPGTFPGGGDGRCGERGLWSRCPSKPRGKVHQNRRKSRHFPRRWRRQVRRERPVEPVPQQATGESAPKSQEIPALSPEVETAGAAREACGAGAPASHGGKCTKIAGNPGTFPGGGDGRCGERGLWSRCPSKPRGKVHQNRRKSRHFPRRWRRQVRRERPVEPVPQQATGESAPKSQKFPALSPEGDTCTLK